METLDATVLYMAHLVEEQQVSGDTLRTLSVKWKVNHAQLSNLQCHLRGVGRQVENKIAEAVSGGSVDELRRRAAEWHAKHPGWRPRAYRPVTITLKNGDFPWWDSEAAKVVGAKPKLAWAVAAAADRPQGDEPRTGRRGAYVERAAESLFDLPEKAVAALEKRYGNGKGKGSK